MNKYIIGILIVGLGFTACTTPNEKEIGEVDALIKIINDTEKSLLSVDTSEVFAIKKQMENDIAQINTILDTLTREEAFMLDDVFGDKKRIYSITKNYGEFIKQLTFAKTQLNNLKQDLENDLIKTAAFEEHFLMEKDQVMLLDKQINKVILGVDMALEKIKLGRPELLAFIEQKKLKAATNE